MGQQVDNLQRQIDDCNRVIEQCRNNMKNNSAAGREQWKHTFEQKQEQKKNLQAQMSIARANDKLAADKEKERLAQEKAKQKEREAEQKKRNKEGGQEKAQQSKPSSSSSSTYATSTPSSSTYSRPASSGPSLTEVIASGMAQRQQRKQERQERARAVLAQMAENQRRLEAASHEAYPEFLDAVKKLAPEEEAFAASCTQMIRNMDHKLPLNEWVEEFKKASDASKKPCNSIRFAELVKLIDQSLVSEDQQKLLVATNYTQYSQRIQEEWKRYAERLKGYGKEHYADTAEYKQSLINEMNEEMAIYAKTRGDKSKLELPEDALHAAAFINYSFAQMMDFTIKSEKRKEWRKCYNKAIKKAKTAFSGNTEIMALVAKAPENTKLYLKKYCSHPTTIFKALLLLVPVIGGFATGHNVFPFIWAILFGAAKWIDILDDLVSEVLAKSIVMQILWWIWLGVTLGLILALMIAGFSWKVILGLLAALAVGFVMLVFVD